VKEPMRNAILLEIFSFHGKVASQLYRKLLCINYPAKRNRIILPKKMRGI